MRPGLRTALGHCRGRRPIQLDWFLLVGPSQAATRYFKLPPNRVVELGSQIEL